MQPLRQRERVRQGRKPEPSAGSMDSQSIKTAPQNDDLGFDRHQRIKGRKRHLVVDTLGLIIAVGVTAASVEDRQGCVTRMTGYLADGVKRLRKMGVDGGDKAGWLAAGVRG